MRKGLVKLLRKAWNNRVTILAVRSSGGSTRGVSLPALAAVGVVLIAAGFAVAMIVSYIGMSLALDESVSLNEAKDAEIERLVHENVELRGIVNAQQLQLAYQDEQIQAIAQKIQSITHLGEAIVETLASEIELSPSLELAIERLSTKYEVVNLESAMGAGGVDRNPGNHSITDTLRTFRTSDSALAVLESMDVKLTQDMQAFESLKNESISYVHKLRHTPRGWPVSGLVTSGYGWRIHPIDNVMRFHDGIDIAVPVGTPVRATADGVVISAGTRSGYGLAVLIDHGYGIQTLYAHNSKLAVKPGAVVVRGQVIAYSGNTGVSTGPHLHYEVRVGGRSVNPEVYLD